MRRGPVAFVAGFLGGFVVALMLLVMPLLGLGLLLVLVAASLRIGRHAAGGAFVGVGIGVVVWLAQAQLRCFSDAHCTAPDITGLVVVAGIFVVAGLGALVAPRRSHDSPR